METDQDDAGRRGPAAEGDRLDYKTVNGALAVCLLSLLGVVFGYWNSRIEQTAGDSRTTNEHQWEGIQHLREDVLGLISEEKQLRRQTDDQEERLRHVEHEITKIQHDLAQLKETRR